MQANPDRIASVLMLMRAGDLLKSQFGTINAAAKLQKRIDAATDSSWVARTPLGIVMQVITDANAAVHFMDFLTSTIVREKQKFRLEVHMYCDEQTSEINHAIEILQDASTVQPARFSIKRATLYDEPFDWD